MYRRITTERFLQLAASIIQVFPLEEVSVYYVPYEKNPHGYPRAARGKLFSTYHYFRKQLKQFGLIPSHNEKSASKQQVPSATHNEGIILYIINKYLYHCSI